MVKKAFKHIRDQYVINQVHRTKIPDFAPDRVFRYCITFSGRVQKVGFRLEVAELAKRLNLTEYCKNLPNGDVLADSQGPDSTIHFLITFMESLIRIKITNKVMDELPILAHETGFKITA